MKTLKERILKLSTPEPNTGCWLWIGSSDPDGYGSIYLNRKERHRAHRISYKAFNGDFDSNLLVCHQCDVPSCVNPDHLFLGTHQDNVKDMDKKGRRALKQGELNPSHKLSNDQVNAIRSLLSSGVNQYDIAKLYSLSQSAVSNIKRGKAWSSN